MQTLEVSRGKFLVQQDIDIQLIDDLKFQILMRLGLNVYQILKLKSSKENMKKGTLLKEIKEDH